MLMELDAKTMQLYPQSRFETMPAYYLLTMRRFSRVAVDMKFPIHIHIHIHRFCVDIHGYIHIHRCLSVQMYPLT